MKPRSTIVALLLAAHVLVLCLPFSHGCMKSSSSDTARRRGKSLDQYDGGGGSNSLDGGGRRSQRLLLGRVRVLNRPDRIMKGRRGFDRAVTPNIRMRKGEHTYGRFYVPYDGGPYTCTILASWRDSGQTFYGSPLWMFVKRAPGVPTTSDFEKNSITFLTRGYSRLRMERARPGAYHLLLQALEDLDGLTITILLNSEGRGAEEGGPAEERKIVNVP